MKLVTIEKLKYLKESEDRVEFKKGQYGNISYDGGSKSKPSDRRRCILGYVVALCNEKGGCLVIGMTDKYPHEVVGTNQNLGTVGELESKIYNDIGIRPNVFELYENSKRVLVIQVPSRPVGKVFKFEDVALMRVGEELRPMSDEYYLAIVQEQEPDFSQALRTDISVEDLDENAIEILKEKYAFKQNNPLFKSLSKHQILNDLELIKNDKLTNAALILLGKEDVLKNKLPQASIQLEYRSGENQIPFENRIHFKKCFYLTIDELWNTINLRNGSVPIQDGAYIFNIPFFNEEVIRESINNAIAHRDYRIASEIVIKQFPQRLDIINSGGFPIGVTVENLLNVPSTPRNRLLTEILQKTGIVERSGQGVDKIYFNTLSEGKAAPDYTSSDSFQVVLKLSAMIQDKAFALFIDSVQKELANDKKLSVSEIITLNKINKKKQLKNEPENEILESLFKKGLVEKRGKTNAVFYILSKDYYEFADEKAEYYRFIDVNDNEFLNQMVQFLNKEKQAKMKDLATLFKGRLTRRQVRLRVDKFVKNRMIEKKGEGKSAFYVIGQNYINQMDVISKALEIGMKEIEKNQNKRPKKGT